MFFVLNVFSLYELDRLLTLNDLINTVLTRYENILKGIFDQPKELNQQSLLQPKAKEETISSSSAVSNSDSWLIDLSEPEPPLGQIRITSNTNTTTSFSSTNESILNNSTSFDKGFIKADEENEFNIYFQRNEHEVEVLSEDLEVIDSRRQACT
ncbi:444_t:CDS:2 [Entrophospora sp. SA101]|nr:444_t:CDS:2 [Entrophospora sp. SA101]